MNLKKTLPAAIFLLLASVFQELFRNYVVAILVAPIFSTIRTASYWLDFVSLLSGFAIIALFVVWAIRRVRLSEKTMSWLIAIVAIYLYYRISKQNNFVFIPFRFELLKRLALLDCMTLLLPGLVIYGVTINIKRNIVAKVNEEKRKEANEIGFLTDAPITLNEQNDKFNRWQHIPVLKEKILATKNSERAFAIAVIGKWGSGKTSFLQGIRAVLEKEKNIVYIKFNPWTVQDSRNITAAFFSELAVILSKYDHSIKDQILEYAQKLIAAYDNSMLNKVRNLFEWANNDLSVQELYKELNKAIKIIGRKLFIEIDDVDRLDEHEVAEVLKIVRNTADFGNTFFFVAFDRNYVLNSIKKKVVDQNFTYLEKIFQLEYNLPLNNDHSIVENSFYNAIFPYLTQAHKESWQRNSQEPEFLGHPEVFPTLSYYLSTERDVVRLRNTFLLNYEQVKEDVYFPDFLYISILKIKYPEVYQLLYYQPNIYLTGTTLQAGDHMELYTGIYRTRFDTDKKDSIKDTVLYKELGKSPGKYALLTEEVKDVVNLIMNIFPQDFARNFGLQRRRTHKLNHLSIDHIECFDRYFDFSLQGRLSENEFEEIMQSDTETMKQRISSCTANREIASDLRIKLEHSTSTMREKFEKQIAAIIYFANQPIVNTESINHYNNDDFLKKLGGRKISKNRVLTTIYNDDIDNYKQFLRKCFQERTDSDRLGFMTDFGIWLLKDEEDEFVLSQEEIQQLLLKSFYSVLDARPKWNNQLMGDYGTLVRLFTDNTLPSDSPIRPVGAGLELSKRFRDYIKDNSFIPFLEYNIYLDHRTMAFQVGKWHEVIFGSTGEFEECLESRKNENEEVKEYYRFYWQYKQVNAPIPFEFQYLTIR